MASSRKNRTRCLGRCFRPTAPKSIEAVSVMPQSVAGNVAGEKMAMVQGKGGRKKSGTRLWMRLDKVGNSELMELDKGAVIKRVGIPVRDLRVLGPLFSNSSTILAREKAMVVNLEFIRAIVTAEEVLLLDPLRQEVLPFVEQLRQQLSLSPFLYPRHGHEDPESKEMTLTCGEFLTANDAAEGALELPFEFQVLELALEVVCLYIDSSVSNLEGDAYPVLDELARNVSTKNLEHVRSLKSNLTRLLARVQKVRDELEHLLDDNEDMSHLYLTRKQMQFQQYEALIPSGASNIQTPVPRNLEMTTSNFQHNASIVTTYCSDYNDVEDLEMLLEAYFMQLDGARNKIISVREYISDTEDYVNIQLDNQRNELIQLQLKLSIVSFPIAVNTLIVGLFSMNIPCDLYHRQHLFKPLVGGISASCFLLFLFIVAYARWKKLLGS